MQRLRGAFDGLASKDGRLTLRTFLKLLSAAGAATAQSAGGLGLTHAEVLKVNQAGGSQPTKKQPTKQSSIQPTIAINRTATESMHVIFLPAPT